MNAKKKKNTRLYILIALVVVLGAGAAVAKRMGWIGGDGALGVEFAEAKRVEIVERVNASGKIQPEIEVKIAPDVSGEITELYVQEGDSVREGQLLLKIRPDTYVSALSRTEASLNSTRANLEQSKARYEQAKAQYLRSKTEYQRQKTLFDDKVISEQELLTAKTNMEVAEADMSAAEKNVDAARYSVKGAQATRSEARTNLNFTEVYAPMSGIISKLSVEKGERVVGTIQMSGTEMLRIANLQNMEVRVDVNENDVVRVSLQDTALVEVDAYDGQTFKGIVTSIANSANESLAGSDGVTEFEVKIRLLNDSYSHLVRPGRLYPFRPGMTAAVEVITERKPNTLAVPLASVTTRGRKEVEKAKKQKGDAEGENEEESNENETSSSAKTKDEIVEVIFLHQDGRAILREVKTGISDFDNIEILEGIQEGEKLISGPYNAISKRLKHRQKVKKQEEGGKKRWGRGN